MKSNGDDIVAVLERVAIMAEVSSHHTPDGSMRLMPAAGVADVIYEAMHTIVDLRIDLEVARGDATEAETFAEEILDKVQVPRTKSHINEREVVLVTPKTGMLLQIPLPPPLEAGPAAQQEYDELRRLFQEVVDHLNGTTGEST